MSTTRTVYAIPSQSFVGQLDNNGKPDKGKFQVLYEGIEKPDGSQDIHEINKTEFFDDPAMLYIHSGYSKITERNNNGLVKFKVKESENYIESAPGQTRYIGSVDYCEKISQHSILSFIEAKLPPAGNPFVCLPYDPISKYIYIVDNGKAYGPFEYEKSDSNSELHVFELRISSQKSANQKLTYGHVYEFDFELASNSNLITNSEGYSVLMDAKGYLNLFNAEPFIYLTPMATASILKEVIKTSAGKVRANSLIPVMNVLSNNRNKNISKNITEAIQDQIKAVDTAWSSDLGAEIFSIIKSSKNGPEFLSSMNEGKMEEFKTNWRQQAEDEHKELTGSIATAKVDSERAGRELIERKRALVSVESKILAKEEKLEDEGQFEAITLAQTAKLDQNLKEKREELSELKLSVAAYSNLKELNAEVVKKEYILDHTKDKIQSHKESLTKISDELKESEVYLQNKLRKIAPAVSALIQAPMPVADVSYEIPKVEVTNAAEGEDAILIESAVKFVLNLHANLVENHQRYFSLQGLASLLVAKQQSFITILTGPPGVGKTSFYRILSGLLGQDKFSLEVPVGKAWLSDREFLGFHNSLTDRFAPAPSGVYQYLKSIEGLSADEIPCTSVLLDEANLSPIEQYWSQFMVMADSESKRQLSLNNECLTLPSHLHFMATTNHDMTTEPLSHRLIDRAPIIPMDIICGDEVVVFEGDATAVNVLSASTLESYFGKESVFSDSINEDADRVFNSVIQLLTNKDPKYGPRFEVSPRKKSNMKRYFGTLSPLMAHLIGGDKESLIRDAIDYSVLYFLLPLVSGTGAQVGSRLNALLVTLEQHDLLLSSDKVKDMIARAEYTLDTYSYFQY